MAFLERKRREYHCGFPHVINIGQFSCKGCLASRSFSELYAFIGINYLWRNQYDL